MKHMAMSLKGTFQGTNTCEGVERAGLVHQQRTELPVQYIYCIVAHRLRELGSVFLPDKERSFLVA